MSKAVKYSVRIDDSVTNQIFKYPNEQYPIFNGPDGKMYRMKILSEGLTQQEITIDESGAIVETGDPILYQQKE